MCFFLVAPYSLKTHTRTSLTFKKKESFLNSITSVFFLFFGDYASRKKIDLNR